MGCGCLSVLGMHASGSNVLMYHAYIINIYSCASIIVWGCTLICMCMVTLLFMRFCVLICVYMYSCMYLFNCIFIDCLYYWSLLTMYCCFLWICSANFGIKQLELELELEHIVLVQFARNIPISAQKRLNIRKFCRSFMIILPQAAIMTGF